MPRLGMRVLKTMDCRQFLMLQCTPPIALGKRSHLRLPQIPAECGTCKSGRL